MTNVNTEKLIQQDLVQISKEFSNQEFIVGPLSDDYAYLARLYWGDGINEFVSIQYYNLYLKNETILFQKEFHPIPNINERREIWINGGISKQTNDLTDYGSLIYLISLDKNSYFEGFNLIKKYNSLSVFKKQ